MANYREKIAFLRDYIANKDDYLPLIDHAWRTFGKRSLTDDVNIGWNAGIVEGNRPYFCECWADGYTAITYFISTKGIEDYTVVQLEDMLKKAGIIWYVGERKYKTYVKKFCDDSNNDFFSINMIVGDDDGTYTDGGIIYGFNRLNEFNESRQRIL